MSKTASLLIDDQIPLAPAIQAVHKANGERIRKLLGATIAANRSSLSDLSRETGIDNSQVTRMLSGDAGLRVDFFAAVMAKDHAGVLIQGLAAMCGYEATPKQPDPAAENRRLRDELHAMQERLARVLAEVA